MDRKPRRPSAHVMGRPPSAMHGRHSTWLPASNSALNCSSAPGGVQSRQLHPSCASGSWIPSAAVPRSADEPSASAASASAHAPLAAVPPPESGGRGGANGAQLCLVRSAAERLSNPERLILDRRGLKACPVLQDEERLRLLNYQNNEIGEICNLHGLPHLIFLDMYSNRIHRIGGLEAVPTLRVLMLGKNAIRRIENLHCLPKLDVLDLHCNQLVKVEGLGSLAELRVLNLAGNAIEQLDAGGLGGLLALTELNARRNKIASIEGVESLPSIQRLFLSYNQLTSLERLVPLSSRSGLVELTLDGNSVSGEATYRGAVLEMCRSLRSLDVRRVTDEERRQASRHQRREGEKAQERARHRQAEEMRTVTLRAIRQAWEAGREAAAEGEGASGETLGLVDVEATAGITQVHVIGEPSDPFDKIERDVNTVIFQYTSCDRLREVYLPRLRRLAALRELILEECGLDTLAQLSAVSQVGQLTSLTIKRAHNGVVLLSHFRPFVLSLLPHLQSVNGEPVSEEERAAASRCWGRLQHMYSVAASCTHARAGQQAPKEGGKEAPKPKPGQEPSRSTAAEAAGVSNAYIAKVVEHAVMVNEKIAQLNRAWPKVIRKYEEEVRAEMMDPSCLQKRYAAVVCCDVD